MKKFCFVLLSMAAALAITPAALANTIGFTITGDGITSSGTFTFQPTGTPGIEKITAITGNFSTTNDGGFSGAITGLPSGSWDSSNPSSNSLSVWDNLFYPGKILPRSISATKPSQEEACWTASVCSLTSPAGTPSTYGVTAQDRITH